mmetsp:Transcript_21282/g.64023  ORF Transcript_21282/g.64023 Transcript_21282/m.64023 type:complete len:549 (-) Transcript_21282:626-2272(-)
MARTWHTAAAVVCLLLACCAPLARGQACPKTHPLVGYKASFLSLEHDFQGDIEVLDDCTFRVTNFQYDGTAPVTFWYGAKDIPSIDEGTKIVDEEVSGRKDGDTETFTLSPGVTWSDFTVIVFWCVDFNADLGHVELLGGRPTQTPAPTRAPLPNCVPLTGRYLAHWQLDNPDPEKATKIRMALEARSMPGHWMGFGFNDPNLTEVNMVGSDVTIVGYVDGKGFAMDYQLQSREQCNYADGGDMGVCPDASQAGAASANSVRMLDYSYINGVLRVEFERPLNASDRFDWQWVVGRERPITWAMGPLSEASTAETPIVLYHLINGEPVNAAMDFKLDLGQPQNTCPASLGGSPPGSTAAPQKPGVVKTLSGVETFTVTTGPNLNYPNPPAWGLSYHINGMESPMLEVVRGTNYTFRVQASMSHPFYLTSSEVGGAGRIDNPTETVYLGGEGDAAGTPDSPFVLSWRPTADTPDDLYYQCHTHQKLGWKIRVLDAGEPSPAAAELDEAAAPAPSDSSTPAPTSGASTTLPTVPALLWATAGTLALLAALG